MLLNLEKVPFSANGAYIAISQDVMRAGGGVWLRGLIRPDWGAGRKKTSDHLLRLLVTDPQGGFLPAEQSVQPDQIIWRAGQEELRCVIETDDSCLFEGGLGLMLEHDHDDIKAYNIVCGENKISFSYPAIQYQVELTALKGTLSQLEKYKRFRALPDQSGQLLLRIQAAPRTLFKALPPRLSRSAQMLALEKAEDFKAWKDKLGCSDPVDALCAYTLWSSVYHPLGLIHYRCCAISKQLMNLVWSWDNCFNALAVCPADPELALQNYLMLFDGASPQGRLADAVNPVWRVDWFTKPPVHGYLLKRLLMRMERPDDQTLNTLYDGLARWTRWWYQYTLQNGLAYYQNPYDSGWDNATCFDSGCPLATPDLNAYLVAQQDYLAELSAALGRETESVEWKKNADALLAAMLDKLWTGKAFDCLRADGERIKSDSLIRMMPLMLGRRLPAKISAVMADELMIENHFLTCRGVASESLRSPAYDHRHNEEITKPNAYWRGPVWAPPVYLLVCGLQELGLTAQAREISARYRATVRMTPDGIYENYDAASGQGLDDTDYSWSASVYLLLKNIARP